MKKRSCAGVEVCGQEARKKWEKWGGTSGRHTGTDWAHSRTGPEKKKGSQRTHQPTKSQKITQQTAGGKKTKRKNTKKTDERRNA